MATRDKYFGSHEFRAHDEVVQQSSNRNFGLVFAGVFALVTGIGAWKGSHHWWIWLAVAAAFAALALAAPRILEPLNRIWTRFGLLLHTVVNPVILAIMFFGCVAPIGFLMRLSGKDPLRRRFDPAAPSYWLPRDPPGPAPESFQRQF